MHLRPPAMPGGGMRGMRNRAVRAANGLALGGMQDILGRRRDRWRDHLLLSRRGLAQAPRGSARPTPPSQETPPPPHPRRGEARASGYGRPRGIRQHRNDQPPRTASHGNHRRGHRIPDGGGRLRTARPRHRQAETPARTRPAPTIQGGGVAIRGKGFGCNGAGLPRSPCPRKGASVVAGMMTASTVP